MYSAKDFGITVVKTSGNEEYCLCPFHEDRSPSASFNRAKGVLVCYVCGRGWNLAQLQDALDVALDPTEMHRDIPDFDLLETRELFDLGVATYHPYFEERGIPKKVIDRYFVRWKESEPQAAVLPITLVSGKVTGVAYRYLSGSTRYKVYGRTTPVWPMHLFGTIDQGRKVVVTEGAWSAMRIASVMGFEVLPLALLGAKAGDAVVTTLAPFECIFLYDGDPAGERACRKLRSLFPTAHAWTLPVSPDDMDNAEVEALFEKLHQVGAL